MPYLLVLFIGLAFLLSVASQPQTGTGFWIQELSAELTPDQVVNPCSRTTSHRGTGGCIIDRGAQPTSIRCEIVHTVEDFVDITIRHGLPGTSESGPAIHHFTDQELFGFFRGEIARATFLLFEDDDDVDEAPFLNGEWYVLITSEECPNGALRGQFTSEYNIASLLRGFNEVPPISSPDQGYALGYYNPDPSSRRLEVIIEHSLQEETAATLNVGAKGERGEVLQEFDSVDSPITGSIDLDEELEEELYATNLYLNIQTENFPRGEIRDQLHVIDAIPRINYAFTLDSSQLVPPSQNPSSAKGYAIFSVDCNTGAIEYMISHNVVEVQTISLHFGGSGEEGVAIHILNGIVSPVLGRVELSTGQYVALLSGTLYVQISSEEVTNEVPVIRGQVRNQYSHYAYLSGTQVVPIVTTAAKGLALFNLNGNSLDYIIHYDNIATTQSIEIRSGVVGVNGGSVASISVSSSGTTHTGSTSVSNSQEIRSGDTYLLIESNRFSSGELRGQIYGTTGTCQFPPVVPVSDITYIISSSSSDATTILISKLALATTVLLLAMLV